jgi:hypothetical protein
VKTLTLSGLQWHAWSPSLLELVAPPGNWRVTIAFDSRSWLIALNDVYGLTEFATREQAARTVALALEQAMADCSA